MDVESKPLALLLLGMGGAGKSCTARELFGLLKDRSYSVELIRMDELRKQLAPPGSDPFSSDSAIKELIYDRASQLFQERLDAGFWLVIDSGMSVERIRKRLRERIDRLRIIHIDCPLWLCIWRDTNRSLLGQSHERGRFLHARAILDLLNPFKKNKFPQPGITYPFEDPDCADLHIKTVSQSPQQVAGKILTALNIGNS